MEHIKDITKFSYHASLLNQRLGAVLLSAKAAMKKLNEMEKSYDWYVSGDDRWDNKQRMKEAGLAVIGYRRYLTEMSTLGLAKVVEDGVNDLKEDSVEFNIWKPNGLNPRFLKTIQKVRALGNAVKHSRSIIRTGRNGRENTLIQDHGLSDGDHVGELDLNVDELACHTMV